MPFELTVRTEPVEGHLRSSCTVSPVTWQMRADAACVLRKLDRMDPGYKT